jgi:dynamin 1-like protein
LANGSSLVSREDDAATDSADEFPPGVVASTAVTSTTTRSVSATLQHERERPRGAGAKASPRSSNASDSRITSSHRGSHANPNASQQQHSAHGSPQTARESLLTYIFGQNGPGPIGASSVVSAAAASSGSAGGSGALHGPGVGGGGGTDVVASGRDTSGGADVLLGSGLLAGKHDGNSAAYDMRSLGKHIEAVRPLLLVLSATPHIKTESHTVRRHRSPRAGRR